MGNVSIQLLILDLIIDLDNVGDSTGVDMQAHDVAMHEAVRICVRYGPTWLLHVQVKDLVCLTR